MEEEKSGFDFFDEETEEGGVEPCKDAMTCRRRREATEVQCCRGGDGGRKLHHVVEASGLDHAAKLGCGWRWVEGGQRWGRSGGIDGKPAEARGSASLPRASCREKLSEGQGLTKNNGGWAAPGVYR